jgi:hypothetical protein
MASELTANGAFHERERPVPSVTYTVTPPTGPRQRLSTLFRPILALPHILIVGGPGIGAGAGTERTGLFGAVAFVAAVINWFAIVFTGKGIAGIQGLQVSYLKWRANAVAYMALLRDEYPPFGEGDYPVQAQFKSVTEDRERLSVAFRMLLVLPHAFLLLLAFIAWIVTAVIGWFAILFTGQYPEGLWRFGEGVMRWSLRIEAYVLLLHDEYPPFGLEE